MMYIHRLQLHLSLSRYVHLARMLVLGCVISSSQAQQPSTAGRADSILILKKDHLLELLSRGKVIRTYKVALGQGGLPPKQREGDARPPRAATLSIRATPPASITRLFMFPIPTPTTASVPRNSASLRAARS